MKYKNNYWNAPKTINWFCKQPVPEYWIIFFRNKGSIIKKVLELGCGAGRNTQFLFESGYDVYACDWYSGMVDATRKRLCEIGFNKQFVEKRVINASMLSLPYENKYFDAVLSNGVYHNVSNLKEIDLAFKETSRVLKKNGYLCFNLFSSKYIDPSLREINTHVYKTKEKLSMILLSKKELINYFTKYGLVPEEEIVEYIRELTTGKR